MPPFPVTCGLQVMGPMKLVKVICELRYSSQMSLLKAHEDLYETFMGEKPKDVDRWLTPGVKFDREQAKESLVAAPERTAFEIHEPASPGHAAEKILQRFESVAHLFGVPDVLRWGLRTFWIEPSEGSLDDLSTIFKGKVFGGFELAKEASDIACVFDFKSHVESERVHLQAGPMWPEQLREQYVRWASADLPQAFIFIDVDYSTSDPKSYSRLTLGKFAKKGLEAGKTYARKFVESVAGGGA